MSQTCYRKYSGGLFDSSYADVPCPNQKPSSGGFLGCCGRGDACLADGLCAYNHTQVGGSGTYTQSCTDVSYNDVACSQHCTDQPRSDVIYNATNQVWACCSQSADNEPDCANPTNETFFANPFWPLFISAQAIASGGTSQSIQTSATSSVPLVSASSTTTNAIPTCTSHPSSLSTGARAGIGVGFAIAGLIILGCAAWLFMLSRALRRLKKENHQLTIPKPPLVLSSHSDMDSVPKAQYTAEMDSAYGRHRSELGGQ